MPDEPRTDSTPEVAPIQVRQNPRDEKPFLWQSRVVLQKIRTKLEEPATALCVYVALTELASQDCAQTFQATHAAIAQHAGVSERTVFARLADLESIGVVNITRPRVRGAATYRLLSVAQPRP
jgi:hypothetical protein